MHCDVKRQSSTLSFMICYGQTIWRAARLIPRTPIWGDLGASILHLFLVNVGRSALVELQILVILVKKARLVKLPIVRDLRRRAIRETLSIGRGLPREEEGILVLSLEAIPVIPRQAPHHHEAPRVASCECEVP